MSRPNVLIFLVDQMPFEVTESAHPCRLPRLAAFAREGVTFTSAHTPSPHCCPSRATLMSGLYPSRHGIWNNVETNTAHQYGLNPGVKLFSEFLAQSGYRCGYAGKWHVSNEETPGDRGFREYSEYRRNFLSRANEHWIEEAAQGGSDTEERPEGEMLRPGWGNRHAYGPLLRGKEAYRENRWYPRAIEPGLAALSELAAEGEPWCLVISTDMDHDNPVPEELVRQYRREEVVLPASFEDMMEDKPRIYQRLRRTYYDQLSVDEIKQDLMQYWALCSMQDLFFGMILDRLEGTGQSENTLVLFLSDHGDYQYAHGLVNMGFAAFREAYHVPAVVRWPAGLGRPGRRVDEFVSLADFAPTFLELAGVRTDYEFTGRSLVPLLEGGATPSDWPDAFYSQTKGNESYYTQRIVATKSYKYVANWFDYDELYDLRNDPHEMRNLAFPSLDERTTPRNRPQGDSYPRPWPPLSADLDEIRRQLLARMWRFAMTQQDVIFNAYPTAAMPPYGPMVGFGDSALPL